MRENPTLVQRVVSSHVGRIFKDLDFAKAARKARISDEALRTAVAEADAGLVDAYLGGELVKKRVARQGSGKRDGFHTILVFRREERAFFVHLFAKNDEASLSPQDLADLKVYARTLLSLAEDGMELALESGDLVEIKNG